MDLAHIKSSYWTQNEIFNPMGIGLAIDHVTWRNIQKCILPTSNFLLGRKLNFHSYGYRVTN